MSKTIKLWRWGLRRHKRHILRELARLMAQEWRWDEMGLDGKRLTYSERRELVAEWFCLKIEEKYRELMAQNAFRALFGGEVQEIPTIGLPDNIPQLRKIYDQLNDYVVPVFGECEI